MALRVLGTEAEQRQAMRAGVRRLLVLTVPSPVKVVAGGLSNAAKLALSTSPHGSVNALLSDCVDCGVDDLMMRAGGPAWDESGFSQLRDAVRSDLVEVTESVVRLVEQVLVRWQRLAPQVQGGSAAQVDLRTQLEGLVFAGFVTPTGRARLPDLVRYLDAMQARLDRLPLHAERDRLAMLGVHSVEEELRQLQARRPGDPGVEEIAWMVQELRVSLFAQGMRTKQPVSEKRVYKAIDALG